MMNWTARTFPLLGLAAAAAIVAAPMSAGCQPDPSAHPGDGPAQQPTEGGAVVQPAGDRAEIRTADDLLRALETADQGLETLEADVSYLREFGAIEGGQREEWRGKLYFTADVGLRARGGGDRARRGFAVHFHTLRMERAVRPERRAFIFDGRWFVEKFVDEKQMIRREVVPPGEIADPLAIGKGPFPLPIGQKRQDILRRFEVELLPGQQGWPDEAPPQWAADAHQLRLTPREGTDEAREFREVRIWYQSLPATAPQAERRLLPRMARTVHVDGGTGQVQLINHKPNQPLPQGVFDTDAPPREAGWDVQTVEFRRPADGNR